MNNKQLTHDVTARVGHFTSQDELGLVHIAFGTITGAALNCFIPAVYDCLLCAV